MLCQLEKVALEPRKSKHELRRRPSSAGGPIRRRQILIISVAISPSWPRRTAGGTGETEPKYNTLGFPCRS